MIMSGPQRLSPEELAIELLRADPSLDYTSVRERAATAGVPVQPIHYGRARKSLGLPALHDVRTTQAPITRPGPTAAGPASTPSAIVAEQADEQSQGDSGEGDGNSEGDPSIAADADFDDAAEDAPAYGTPSDRGPADIVAPRKKGSAAFDFLLQQLRSEPNIIYADLRARCELAGFKIAPIMYGRAKAVLGLVPVKPRSKKADAVRPAPTGAPMQFRQVESVAADRFTKKLDDVRNLDQLVNAVKELDAERRRLRDLLERVVTMIDEALG